MTQTRKKNLKSFKASNHSIAFSLSGLSIRRFTLVEPGTDITGDFDVNKLKVSFSLDFSHVISDDKFIIYLGIVYHYPLNKNDILLCELILLTEFRIVDLKDVIETKNDRFSLPTGLLQNFVSIAYSTARGILFTKTQGSFLNQFILPLIDSKTLLEQKIRETSND